MFFNQDDFNTSSEISSLFCTLNNQSINSHTTKSNYYLSQTEFEMFADTPISHSSENDRQHLVKEEVKVVLWHDVDQRVDNPQQQDYYAPKEQKTLQNIEQYLNIDKPLQEDKVVVKGVLTQTQVAKNQAQGANSTKGLTNYSIMQAAEGESELLSKESVQGIDWCSITSEDRSCSKKSQRKEKVLKNLQKNSSKNVIKVYGCAILRYARQQRDLLNKILQKYQVPEKTFLAHVQNFRLRTTSVRALRQFLQPVNNFCLGCVVRTLAWKFLREQNIPYFMAKNSIIDRFQYLYYRSVITLALYDPQNFTRVKTE